MGRTNLVRHTKRKREALLSHPNAETLEKQERLRQCEEEIRVGMHDFRRIGKALTDIDSGNLWLRYKSFHEYCRQQWALARRTVYQKMQVYKVYHILEESISSDDLPTHEYQVRQLLTLSKADQQVEAWRLATDSWKATRTNAEKMTTAVVKAAVKQVRAKNNKVLHDYLTADSVFGNIPWRLDVGLLDPHRKKFSSMLELESVNTHLDGNLATAPTMNPKFVLVNPGYDLFLRRSYYDYLVKLLNLCAASYAYRFLMWTTNYRCVEQFGLWPSPVELIVRLKAQAMLDEFAEYWAKSPIRPQCGLWLDPIEQIEIPRTISFTRLLIGASGWQPQHSTDKIVMLRRFVASVLPAYPVHLSIVTLSVFTQPFYEEFGD